MTANEDRTRFRVTIVGLVVLSMLGVLAARLWFLQVLAGDGFAEAALSNSVRLISVEAPRGRILDRNGKEIVKNRTALAVGIRKDDLPDDRAEARGVKRKLARLLDMKVSAIDKRLADKRTSPYKAVVVAEDVPREAIFEIRERQDVFPGVETLALPVRTYPLGSLAAHLIGYVGETNESELAELANEYRLGDSIGRTGVERVYERWLRGKPGLQKLEVDATGRVLRVLGDRPPEPGADLVLSIDADLQAVAEKALAQGIQRARSQTFRSTGQRFRAPAGAAVVMDARSGEVLAMASLPTFSLKRFVGGVDAGYWERLNDPGNHFPLLNRTVQASYPPGSTFKPVVASAALAEGMGSPGGRYPCTTEFRFGDRVFRNWRARNARISVAQSLIESCDTVYYTFARNWWLRERDAERDGGDVHETIQEWARRFGLGAPTGVDLPQESEGRIPGRASRRAAWERNRDEYCERYRKTRDVLFEDLCERGYLWRGGDAVNMSIGQGEVEATPLQMAVAYAAVANGGRVLEPHVAKEARSPGGKVVHRVERDVRAKVDAPGWVQRYVRRALAAVPERGTAVFPYRGWPLGEIPMAAKTGSSEIAGKQPYSWFASYGPADDPRYVAVAVVEEAGFGSQVAGPVVRRLMDHLFDRPPVPIVFGARSD